ncbi:MAG: hypothetical protein WDA42_04155 [Candidatus Bathyarchaeia archaeon]
MDYTKARVRYREITEEELKFNGGIFWIKAIIPLQGNHTEECFIPVRISDYRPEKGKVEVTLFAGDNTCYWLLKDEVYVYEEIR